MFINKSNISNNNIPVIIIGKSIQNSPGVSGSRAFSSLFIWQLTHNPQQQAQAISIPELP